MHCALPDDVAWRSLLQARDLLADGANGLLFVQRDGAWRCTPAGEHVGPFEQLLCAPLPGSSTPTPEPRHGARLSIYTPLPNGQPSFTHPQQHAVEEQMLAMARVYLPVLIGAALARAGGGVFVVGHVTQTLDGRIACLNGQSQWIGNEADRRHCHRMRALLDGVMIGASTALADDPRLTVRHVDGRDPRRIVLSGSGRVLQHGGALQLFTGAGCDVVVADDCALPEPRATARVVKVRHNGTWLEPGEILAALRARGVHSLFVEGGSSTLSSFLAAGAIHLLQVHMAPTVLGSGIPSVQLPAVKHVRDGMSFTMDHAMLDGDLLLSCWPARAGT